MTDEDELLGAGAELGYEVVETTWQGAPAWRIVDEARSWQPMYLERGQALRALEVRLRQAGFEPNPR